MIWRHKRGTFDLTEKGIIMGILNVTPDSFSDGGEYNEVEAALAQARTMISEGAEIIDIGGESTRPGSPPVTLEEELARTIPVIEALRGEWEGAISIDTSKPEVARVAIEVGADIVNDITGLTDPEMVLVCRDGEVGICAMHMKGSPETMQQNPTYDNVISEIKSFFSAQYEMLTIAGIPPNYLCFDPGIGFGKTVEHNLEILRNLPALVVEGRPLLIGLSRKSFIGKILGTDEISAREFPTVALTAHTRKEGAMIHRVHQVKPNHEALRMAEAILSAK